MPFFFYIYYRMAKDRKNQFEEEAKLVSMSAESAKKLATSLQSVSKTLNEIVDGTNQVI